MSLATSSLAGLTERLRRSLNLVGLIEAGFQPEAIGTVLVDDATRPGCNVLNGRYFSGTLSHTVPAQGTGDSNTGIIALNPVILDRLILSFNDDTVPNTVSAAEVNTVINTGAAPFAMATAFGLFNEILTSNGDRPPVLSGISGTAVTGVTVGRYYFAPNSVQIIPLNIHLQVGHQFMTSWLLQSGIVTATAHVTLQGRVF